LGVTTVEEVLSVTTAKEVSLSTNGRSDATEGEETPASLALKED
jgi:hypothetical protein